ncbi:hypothetical protein KAX02_08305 [candidate division WOR-3 bacterium]|nr:hypothetical protein [candidate division WOR-3 bacterium]
MKTISPCIVSARQEQIVEDIRRKVELFSLGQYNEIPTWTDMGQLLGTEQRVVSLLRFDGNIYGGTYGSGLVLRYNAIDDWTQIGALGISADYVDDLKEFENKMYAATTVGGKVFRRDADNDWADMGQLGNGSAVFCLLKFDGNFYGGTNVSGGVDNSNVWRMDGVANWAGMGKLGSSITARCLNEFNGGMYVGTGMQGKVYLFISPGNWTDYGQLGTNNEIYTLETHEGSQYGAGYGDGHVYRMDGIGSWTSIGQPVPALKIIYKLKSYFGTLYAFTDNSNAYRWEGGTEWTAIGQPNSATKLYSAESFDDVLFCGTGEGGHVFSFLVEGIELTTIRQGGIGRITQRVERNLNQFQPADISAICKEPVSPLFFKNDQTGYFDKENLNDGYRVKVSSGIEGCEQWITKFDGKLNTNSVKRPIRERINFTAKGWLDNLKTYNAELIADTYEPAFKNITGLHFASCGDGSKVGAQYMDYGIETNGDKWVSLSGGEKVVLETAGTTYEVFDKVEETSINVYVSLSLNDLPLNAQQDSFTIKEVGGTLIACGWWNNISLEDLVGKVFTECGITEQDIQVEDIEINHEKNFITLPKLQFADSIQAPQITAIRVVDINDTDKEVTMLIGIRIKIDTTGTPANDWRKYIYRIIINWETQEIVSTTTIISSGFHRVLKIFKFGGEWWTLYGLPSSYDWETKVNYPDQYYATWLNKFNSNLDGIDYSYQFPSQPQGTWDVFLGNSFDTLSPSSNDCYHMRNQKTSDPDEDYQLTLYKVTWNGSVLTPNLVKILEREDNDNTHVVGQCKGTLIPESTDNFYYFGIRDVASQSNLEIRKYALTGDTFTTVKSVTTGSGTSGNFNDFTRNVGAGISLCGKQGYYNLQKTASVVESYWIGYFGGLTEEVNPEEIKNIIFSNPDVDFDHYFIYWFLNNLDSKYYIKRTAVILGNEYKEDQKLDPKYAISDVAPCVFYEDGDDGKCWFVGAVSEGDNSVVPFLYAPLRSSYIQVADFTGMNCKDALSKLAEGFVCNFDIPEMTKGRFYFRGKTGGEMTLDSDQCIKQPKIEYWGNQCDGVIVENSKKDIRYRYKNTDFGDRIIKIDNVFITSNGMAKWVAEWIHDFFGQRRLLISVDVKFLIEIELLDKITIKLRNADGTLFREIETIVMETSFEPSPEKETTHRVSLKLLQLTGDTLHIPQLIELDETSEMFVTV